MLINPIVLNEVAPDHIVDYPSSLSHTKTYSDTMHPPAKAGFEDSPPDIFGTDSSIDEYDDGKVNERQWVTEIMILVYIHRLRNTRKSS